MHLLRGDFLLRRLERLTGQLIPDHSHLWSSGKTSADREEGSWECNAFAINVAHHTCHRFSYTILLHPKSAKCDGSISQRLWFRNRRYSSMCSWCHPLYQEIDSGAQKNARANVKGDAQRSFWFREASDVTKTVHRHLDCIVYSSETRYVEAHG